jgi:hypothetical protein
VAPGGAARRWSRAACGASRRRTSAPPPPLHTPPRSSWRRHCSPDPSPYCQSFELCIPFHSAPCTVYRCTTEREFLQTIFRVVYLLINWYAGPQTAVNQVFIGKIKILIHLRFHTTWLSAVHSGPEYKILCAFASLAGTILSLLHAGRVACWNELACERNGSSVAVSMD